MFCYTFVKCTWVCCDSVWWLCACIFFFKQKTAYELRISDWSSDVCSSDLATAGAGGADKLYGGDGPDHLIGGSGNDLLAGGAGADRKRVVEGKSVSGRVDLGGRRVSKKNTNDNEGSRHNRTIAINYLK